MRKEVSRGTQEVVQYAGKFTISIAVCKILPGLGYDGYRGLISKIVIGQNFFFVGKEYF